MTYELPPPGPGQCLAALRIFRGLSRSDLAQQAGLHRDHVVFIEGALLPLKRDELAQVWICLSTEETRSA